MLLSRTELVVVASFAGEKRKRSSSQTTHQQKACKVWVWCDDTMHFIKQNFISFGTYQDIFHCKLIYEGVNHTRDVDIFVEIVTKHHMKIHKNVKIIPSCLIPDSFLQKNNTLPRWHHKMMGDDGFPWVSHHSRKLKSSSSSSLFFLLFCSHHHFWYFLYSRINSTARIRITSLLQVK